jgi:protein-disulfide isomerase
MSTPKETKNARRERLAAERAAAAVADRRRRRIFTALGVLVVALVVVGTGIAVQASRNDTSQAALPATVTEPGGPIVRNPDTTSVPILDYWEDFQCPACKDMEVATGDAIRTMVAAGDVLVRYHMLSFLDGRLGNNSSKEAANAFACSADAGKQGEYHDTVYANQPATEGDGYTQEQLLLFGTEVGITGDAFSTFSSCVTDLTYGDYVTSVQTAGSTQAIVSTPTVFLDGTALDPEVSFDPVALTKAVNDAAAAG